MITAVIANKHYFDERGSDLQIANLWNLNGFMINILVVVALLICSAKMCIAQEESHQPPVASFVPSQTERFAAKQWISESCVAC